MKTRIIRTVQLHQSILRKVIEGLSPVTGPIIFIEERKPLMFQEDEFDWDTFFSKCTEYRQSNEFSKDDFLIVLTELKNDAIWFSAFSETGERTIFIHASDWETYLYSEPEFPIAYEVVANVLQSLMYIKLGKQFSKYVHEEPIGCFNDMCRWKPDITFKLRTGDLCNDCLTILLSIIQKDIIEQSIGIFESLRKKMLFRDRKSVV